MQSSRGLHLHGATPSPTDRSNPNATIPSSFHPPEPVPPSPPYFINSLTNQRLTGSMMSYPQVDHHSLSSAPAYQDTVSWQYQQQWNAPVIDAGPSSENPPSVPLHTLGGMVSASHEGSTFVPSLPPARPMQSRSHYFGASTTQAPSFPTSPTSGSPRDLQENPLHFGANVSAGSVPAASPHISQGAPPLQPFNSSPDIWHSQSAGASVSSSPVTPTIAVAVSVGEKGCKGVHRRSPTESTRVNSRYDPVGRPPRGTARSGPASESLTDEGEEERDSDGSVRDVRDKKRRYAKTFRDTEKHLFEKLRHRLFPQDPHAKRSECLERAIESVDELLQLRENEAQRQKEMHYLKQQLSDAERRIERLCRELNGRSHPMGN
ncbi:hypothetical protein EDB92DRAFT_1255383 [Lactarius akahatsu]|uniref:BHLH domain-containing protein n=1 Tax=Lactarius akahatsu TaxID=416441 RepID=A0AAD4LCQ9_9AGAM|nr:hypothetical protein EDB92DRAFT_1255383 [Lactarius akahatsu]